jgi:hypothetical protein
MPIRETVSATATHMDAVSPIPALSARPPSYAPSASAMLKAEWLSAAPSVWASSETSIRRICGAVGRTRLVPRRNTVGIAATGRSDVTVNSATTAAMNTNAPKVVGGGSPVHEPATGHVAGGHPETPERERDRHGGPGRTGAVGEDRADGAADGEHAAAADGAGGDGQPSCGRVLRARGAAWPAGWARAPRHEPQDGRCGQQREPGGGGERSVAAEGLAEPGGGGHADDVRDAESEQDARDGASAALGSCQIGGGERRDAEVGAVRESGQNAP